jgi:hypothetical protein
MQVNAGQEQPVAAAAEVHAAAGVSIVTTSRHQQCSALPVSH